MLKFMIRSKKKLNEINLIYSRTIINVRNEL